MDQRANVIPPKGGIGTLNGKPVIFNWHVHYGEILDTPNGLIVRPTNDAVWDRYYKMYVASERAKGQKYVADLFKGLRFSLGLPQ